MSVLHVQHALKKKSVNLLQTSQIKNLIGNATKNVRAARAARAQNNVFEAKFLSTSIVVHVIFSTHPVDRNYLTLSVN